MKKSKCERKPSKLDKAAEKIADKLGTQDVWEQDLAKRAAIKGAEALLRYAKRNLKAWDHGTIPVEILEEWVKGER